MRLGAGLIGLSAVVVSSFGCGSGILTPPGVVAANEVDTLGEAFLFYVQWVNTNDVKVEFDMTIDNEATVHFELPGRRSLAILIDFNEFEDRDPIVIDADNVTVIRINSPCPDEILFTNVVFGDSFSSGDIIFEQSTVADESNFGPDENGVLQPVTFFCFTSWQIIVQESSITITGLDRAAVGIDEAEVVVDDLLSALTDTGEGAGEDTLGAPPPEPRPTPEDPAPRIIDGPPSIPSVGSFQ